MRRAIQKIGFRKWYGDDFLTIQNEALAAIESQWASFGNFVVSGCVRTGSDISSGIVMIDGKLCRYPGELSVTGIRYLVKVETETDNENYQTGGSKPTYLEITASGQSTVPSDPFLPIPATGSARSLMDVIEENHVHDAAKIISGIFNVARIPNLDAAKITTGTLGVARIPSLPAGQITSGIFDPARIPNLDAAKITTGVLGVGRIPDLDAAKITIGTLGVARIPSLPAGQITSGIFDAARIPNLDAAKITTGTLGVARIPSLPADQITSGTFADARISSSSVTQHLSNYVTLNSNQTITGIKTITGSGNFTDATAARIDIYNTTSGRRWGIGVVGSGLGAGSLQIVDVNALESRLIINGGNGNIGIGGATNPSESIHSGGSLRLDGQGILIGASSFPGDRSFYSLRNTLSNLIQIENSVTGDGILLLGAEQNSNTVFSRRKDNVQPKKLRIVIGSTERMTFNENGNIGINEINPLHALHVGGVVRIDGQGIIVGTNSIEGNRSFQSVKSTSNIIQIDSNVVRFLLEAGQEVNRIYSRTVANANAGFRIQIGTSDRFNIIPTGEIGINKIPTAGINLDVAGIAFVENRIRINTSNNTYSLEVGGDIRATGNVRSNSDKRLKKYINTYSNALEAALKINPYTYTWKGKQSNKKELGLIAQEVQLAIPEVVDQDGNGYLSIDYGKLSSILFGAIKELHNRVQKLESK